MDPWNVIKMYVCTVKPEGPMEEDCYDYNSSASLRCVCVHFFLEPFIWLWNLAVFLVKWQTVWKNCCVKCLLCIPLYLSSVLFNLFIPFTLKFLLDFYVLAFYLFYCSGTKGYLLPQSLAKEHCNDYYLVLNYKLLKLFQK
jgi:hypothetical protein